MNVPARSGLIEKPEQGEDAAVQALALYSRSREKHFAAGHYGADMEVAEKGRVTPCGWWKKMPRQKKDMPTGWAWFIKPPNIC